MLKNIGLPTLPVTTARSSLGELLLQQQLIHQQLGKSIADREEETIFGSGLLSNPNMTLKSNGSGANNASGGNANSSSTHTNTNTLSLFGNPLLTDGVTSVSGQSKGNGNINIWLTAAGLTGGFNWGGSIAPPGTGGGSGVAGGDMTGGAGSGSGISGDGVSGSASGNLGMFSGGAPSSGSVMGGNGGGTGSSGMGGGAMGGLGMAGSSTAIGSGMGGGMAMGGSGPMSAQQISNSPSNPTPPYSSGTVPGMSYMQAALPNTNRSAGAGARPVGSSGANRQNLPHFVGSGLGRGGAAPMGTMVAQRLPQPYQQQQQHHAQQQQHHQANQHRFQQQPPQPQQHRFQPHHHQQPQLQQPPPAYGNPSQVWGQQPN